MEGLIEHCEVAVDERERVVSMLTVLKDEQIRAEGHIELHNDFCKQHSTPRSAE